MRAILVFSCAPPAQPPEWHIHMVCAAEIYITFGWIEIYFSYFYRIFFVVPADAAWVCARVCVCYEMIAPLSATRYSSLLMLYVFFFYSIRFFRRSRAVFSSETLDRLHPHLLCLCSILAVVCLFQCILFHVYLFPWTSWRDYRLIPYGIFFIEFNRKHVF